MHIHAQVALMKTRLWAAVRGVCSYVRPLNPPWSWAAGDWIGSSRPPNDLPVNNPRGGCDCREAAVSAVPLSRERPPSIHRPSLSLRWVCGVIWSLNIAYTIHFVIGSELDLVGITLTSFVPIKLHPHIWLVCVKVEEQKSSDVSSMIMARKSATKSTIKDCS